MRTDKQIFIGGTGRSGTSLLKRILGRHSAVFALPAEMRMLTDPDGILDLVDALSTKWSPYTADMAITRFDRLMRTYLFSSPIQRLAHRVDPRRASRRVKSPWLKRRLAANKRYFGLDFAELGWTAEHYFKTLDDFLRSLHAGRFAGRWIGSEDGQDMMFLARYFQRDEILRLSAEFVDAFFGQRMAQAGKIYWCEDTPFNAIYAHQLLELFPNMKLLYMYRDPRDVVASYVRQRWASEEAEQAAFSLNFILSRWEEVARRLPDQTYLRVKFEDLIADPEGQVRRICDYIEVPYETSMIKLDLSKHNIGRWASDLSPAETTTVTEQLRTFILQGGYEIGTGAERATAPLS